MTGNSICLTLAPLTDLEVHMYQTLIIIEYKNFQLMENLLQNGELKEPVMGNLKNHNSSVVDSLGNVYVSDMNNHLIQKFSADGKFITKWGTKGTGDGQSIVPLGIGIDSSDNVYLVDQLKSSIERFTSDGKFIPPGLVINSRGDRERSMLEHIELDQFDKIYIIDRGEHHIKILVSQKQSD
jgi:6-bladed beta-propeller